MNNFKKSFLLDPNIIFLNHGSYGACPKPVFEEYQQWQRKLEMQPLHFFNEILLPALHKARQKLAKHIHAPEDSIVFIPNATFGINAIARSLSLSNGDEILGTDHEYGACDKTWQFICNKTGAQYKKCPIQIPLISNELFIDQFWGAVTDRTKVIFLSHITSSTAHLFPIKEICARAHDAQIITVIDGAHALGQVSLNLQDIGADFYTSNAHKWLCAPKGAAFLYAREEMQRYMEPLIVSWGWGDERQFTTGSDFLDYYQWTGTNDYSAYLSVPAAIQFQEENNWPEVRKECHCLLSNALKSIEESTPCTSLYNDESFYCQMAITRLPRLENPDTFKRLLYTKYRIEIPVISWNDLHLLRLAIQCYNTQSDIENLITALHDLL